MEEQIVIETLHDAALNGDVDACKRLIESGANVNALNTIHLTPLMVALLQDSMGVITFLLDQGADATIRTKTGNTALMFASSSVDNPQVIEKLVKAGCDVNDSNKSGDTALFFACTKGKPNIIIKLLEYKCNPNEINQNGLTPLMCAATNGHAHCVQILLNAGADITIRSKKQKTALDHCTSKECEDILKAKFAELEESSKKALEELSIEDPASEAPKSTNTKSKKNKKKQSKKEEKAKIVPTEVPKQVVKQEEAPKKTESKTIVMAAKPQDNQNEWTVQQKKKPTAQPVASAWKDRVHTKPVSTPAVVAPSPIVPTGVSSSNDSIEEYTSLHKQFLSQHPLSEDLDLKLSYYIGKDLQKLSMEQLTALEQMHFKAIQEISEAKIEWVRKQERQKLEEEVALQQQKRNVLEKSLNKS